MVKTYYQIPVNSSDQPKIAITTFFGLFKLILTFFELRNVAQTFQCFMSEVLQDLNFTYAYIDDIFIASTLFRRQAHQTHRTST